MARQRRVPYFDGEVLHFNALRMRITGSGNLITKLYSLDDETNASAQNYSLLPATRFEPTLLTNFNEQRAYIDIRTLVKDEWFNISKITVFVRTVSTSLPQ